VRKTRPGARLAPVLTSLVAVGLLIGLFFFGVAAESMRHKDAAGTGAVPAAKPATPKPPGLGAAVRDGKFEFVVSRVDCSRSTVGLEHLKRTAAGKYCVVSLSVRNIATDPQLFLGSAQKAVDTAGVSYTDDEIAAFYANRDTQTFLRKIDPGHRVAGKLVFDVPKAATLAGLELHDSFFSHGVEVTLR
jgi:hypothetical protein